MYNTFFQSMCFNTPGVHQKYFLLTKKFLQDYMTILYGLILLRYFSKNYGLKGLGSKNKGILSSLFMQFCFPRFSITLYFEMVQFLHSHFMWFLSGNKIKHVNRDRELNVQKLLKILKTKKVDLVAYIVNGPKIVGLNSPGPLLAAKTSLVASMHCISKIGD